MVLLKCTSLMVALSLLAAGCGKGIEQSTPDLVLTEVEALPEEPLDSAWSQTPLHVASLLLQDMVDPRLTEPSTREISVRALSNGRRAAFLLSWSDPTKDDLLGPSRFPDGCAIQLPSSSGADLPAPQMGETGRVVEISFWRASWQATIDGRGDSIHDLYPSASVDHYPFDAAPLEEDAAEKKEMEDRYAPARALGNQMAGPRLSPVEALVAQGPGTLTSDEEMAVDGKGVWADGVWSVVISRPLPQSVENGSGQIAFAVWEGSHEESGARKMRTGWIPLTWSAP